LQMQLSACLLHSVCFQTVSGCKCVTPRCNNGTSPADHK
jgi:hypothetical protein